MDPNENDNYRGLHIVVIGKESGNILRAKVFDTYSTCDRFDRFTKTKIPSGHIVLAACKDECTTKLSQKAKKWFEAMGSK